jgi:hypothetical protein
MILAAGRFGIAQPAQTKAVEGEWYRYRHEQGLDLYGKSLRFETLPVKAKNAIVSRALLPCLEYGMH